MARLYSKTLAQGTLVATVLFLFSITGTACGEEAPGWGLKMLENIREAPVIEQEKKSPVRVETPVVKKILVKRFIIEGNTLLPEADLRSVVAQAEGKELTLEDIKGVADLITAKYRDAGFLIVNAFVPTQSIADNTVLIKVVEGYVGEITVIDNKSYSSAFIERHFAMLKKEYTLEEELLERQLLILNDYPSLTVKASLKAGKEPGATDLIATVSDRFPISGSISYDNFGLDSIGKNRLVVSLDVGNLITSGDLVMLRGILGLDTIDINNDSYGRFEYLVPIGGRGIQVGAYVTNSLYAAGEALSPLEINGKALIAGMYATYPLLKKRDETLMGRLGFEYGSVKNYVLGTTDNNDEIRKIITTVSYDIADRYLGRNFIGFSYSAGLGGFLGGTSSGSLESSISGADNSFNKFTLDAMRIQKLPGYNNLTARISGQYSPDRLFLAEQFAIGGEGTVRGFDPAAISGDSGFLGSLELATSPIFPDTVIYNQKIGDTIKFALFTDYGQVYTTDPQPGETSSDHLWSVGAGVRLYVGRNFSCKFDWAVPSLHGSLNTGSSKYYVQVALSF